MNRKPLIASILAAAFLAASCFFLFKPLPADLTGSDLRVVRSSGLEGCKALIGSSSAFYPPFFVQAAYHLVLLGRTPHEGLYRVERGDSLARLLLKMRRGIIAAGAFRIPEGAPLWDVNARILASEDFLHDTASLSAEDLTGRFAQNNYLKGVTLKSMEGLFAPDTYFYTVGKSEMKLLEKAFAQQKRILLSEWDARDSAVNRVLHTPYDALILASIIEKESGLKADRSLISSVFVNRMRIGMPLQTDPTVIYGIGPEFNGNLTRADLRRDTPYNTYRRRGLPPTPISAPSRESIHAALHPADTRYLYFVSRGDGTTQFSESLATHNQAVNDYQVKPAAAKKEGQ